MVQKRGGIWLTGTSVNEERTQLHNTHTLHAHRSYILTHKFNHDSKINRYFLVAFKRSYSIFISPLSAYLKKVLSNLAIAFINFIISKYFQNRKYTLM